MHLGRKLLAAGVGVALAGCQTTGPLTVAGTAPVPKFQVDIGTVDAGRNREFRVTIPVDPDMRRRLVDGTKVVSGHDNMTLGYGGSGPNHYILTGSLDHVANCTGFKTGGAIMRGDEVVADLEISAKVRRAFEYAPIVEGKRYELRMAPGFRPPVVVDRSDGIVATIVPRGVDLAELVITRTKPARVPGGMVRLLHWESGDTQLILLPVPPLPSASYRQGHFLDVNGEATIGANSALTPDKRDVEVVLDPPDAYEIVNRGYTNGRLTLQVRSLTRTPTDLAVGFRRKGQWIEVQRFAAEE